jgi:hypothetical protein
MRTLKDYISEAEVYVDQPSAGDKFDIELAPDQLIETYVLESTDNELVLQADETTMSLLESFGCFDERIARYGAVGSSTGKGYTLGEEQDTVDESRMSELDIEYQDWKKLMPAAFQSRYKMTKDAWYSQYKSLLPNETSVNENDEFFGRMLELAGCGRRMEEEAPYQPNQDADHNDPLLAKQVDDMAVGPMEGIDDEHDEDSDDDQAQGFFVVIADEESGPFVGMIVKDGGKWREVKGQGVAPHNWGGTYMGYLKPEDVMQWIRQDYSRHYEVAGPFDDEQEAHSRADQLSEAEYQGRDVPLGKPMRGDVKKFKVYVKDPSTGNVKKVNFGHGGTSAKRAGQKTMKIKKSNPARRKSFRARHNCDNPGPRTKARYWSCRAW